MAGTLASNGICPRAAPVFPASTSATQCGDVAAGFLTRPLSENLEQEKQALRKLQTIGKRLAEQGTATTTT